MLSLQGCSTVLHKNQVHYTNHWKKRSVGLKKKKVYKKSEVVGWCQDKSTVALTDCVRCMEAKELMGKLQLDEICKRKNGMVKICSKQDRQRPERTERGSCTGSRGVEYVSSSNKQREIRGGCKSIILMQIHFFK